MSQISIIMPVYNAENYLRRAVDSVLCQTFTDFELILVDDGSADNSFEICKEYENKDARVKAIHQENKWIAEARNTAIRNSSAPLLTFVDSDDCLCPDSIETLIKGIEGVDYCVSRKYHRTRKNDPIDGLRSDGTEVLLCASRREIGEHMLELIHYPIYFNGPRVFRRSILEKLGLWFETTMSEDEIFGLRYMLGIDSLRVVENSGYIYFYNPDSISNTHQFLADGEWVNRRFDFEKKLVRYFDIQDPEFMRYTMYGFATRIENALKKPYFPDTRLSRSERLKEWRILQKSEAIRACGPEHFERLNDKFFYYACRYGMAAVVDPFFSILAR